MPRVCNSEAIKVFEQGNRNSAVWQLLRDNIRISDLVVGDMEAQIAACRIGAERYIELIERYGLYTVEAACAALFDYSERLMRRRLKKYPTGAIPPPAIWTAILMIPVQAGVTCPFV